MVTATIKTGQRLGVKIKTTQPDLKIATGATKTQVVVLEVCDGGFF